ncbi:MAG: phenylalanine 4-monooxygenase [Planctomycetota bacterium]
MHFHEPARNEVHLVPLDPDHPGFRDRAYRRRRDEIARLALGHRQGAPVPDAPYVDAEHEVWRLIRARLAPLHERTVASALLDMARRCPLAEDRIPQLAEVGALLAPRTGFRMEPVAGLVEARDFLAPLADGTFRSTQYIRHASRPFYTPEPDVVHELIGHAASLADPDIAELSRAFGRAARAADDDELRRLERVYWYSLEYGLVRERGRVKAVGAGLLSSFGELAQLEDGPRLLPFELGRIAATGYDPTRYQPLLFVAPSWAALVDELWTWLDAGGWRGRARSA